MARRKPSVGSIKRDKRYFAENISHFVLEKMLDRERRETKVFFGNSLGFVGRKSSSQELKFITSMRVMRRQ